MVQGIGVLNAENAWKLLGTITPERERKQEQPVFLKLRCRSADLWPYQLKCGRTLQPWRKVQTVGRTKKIDSIPRKAKAPQSTGQLRLPLLYTMHLKQTSPAGVND